MTSQQQLVCDNSTVANFVQWASAISNFFRTAGWINSADTGQLNGAGANNWAGVTTIPGNGAYYYEIFEPNDGLTNFYVKIEYGNINGSTNSPSIRISISTATNGAGTLTGYVVGPQVISNQTYTAPSTTTQFTCYFSGAAGRIGVMMWVNGTTTCQQFFAIERSLASAGSYTGTHATLLTAGFGGGQEGRFTSQATLVFAVGVTPNTLNDQSNTTTAGWCCRLLSPNSTSSSAFNGSIPFDTPAPAVGYFDYPLTVAGVANFNDIVEGVSFTATLYGSARTYMPSKQGAFAYVGPLGDNAAALAALCMRYD